jgi:uncharacterized membrane protein YccC
MLAARPTHPAAGPHARLPDDTRLWAALQQASGGTWSGCIYDVDRIVKVLDAGLAALRRAQDGQQDDGQNDGQEDGQEDGSDLHLREDELHVALVDNVKR